MEAGEVIAEFRLPGDETLIVKLLTPLATDAGLAVVREAAPPEYAVVLGLVARGAAGDEPAGAIWIQRAGAGRVRIELRSPAGQAPPSPLRAFAGRLFAYLRTLGYA